MLKTVCTCPDGEKSPSEVGDFGKAKQVKCNAIKTGKNTKEAEKNRIRANIAMRLV